MTPPLLVTETPCPECGKPLVQIDPRTIYGCPECQIAYRLTGGRLVREIGRHEVLKRKFYMRTFERDDKRETYEAGGLMKLAKEVTRRPWWKIG